MTKSRTSYVSWGFDNIVFDLNDENRDELLAYYLGIAQDSYTDYTNFAIEIVEKYVIGEEPSETGSVVYKDGQWLTPEY